MSKWWSNKPFPSQGELREMRRDAGPQRVTESTDERIERLEARLVAYQRVAELPAVERLEAWAKDWQLSARLGTPHYANPGELKRDILEVLAALSALDTGRKAE